MCKDCWFSKYNKVLLHYSVSMAAAGAAAAAAAVAYIPLSAAVAAGGGCCSGAARLLLLLVVADAGATGGGRRRRRRPISLSQRRTIRITALWIRMSCSMLTVFLLCLNMTSFLEHLSLHTGHVEDIS